MKNDDLVKLLRQNGPEVGGDALCLEAADHIEQLTAELAEERALADRLFFQLIDEARLCRESPTPEACSTCYALHLYKANREEQP